MFAVRLVAYEPAGARLGPLPDPLDLQASFVHNDTGALNATYSRLALRGEILDRALSTGLELAFEVAGRDGSWVEPDGGRFVWVAKDDDVADSMRVVKITAPSYGWLLGKARLLDLSHLLPADHSQAGKRPFYSASAGTILATLMGENRARRGVPVDLDFGSAKDSSAAAWAQVASLYYAPGVSVSQVLANLAAQGMCDWRTRARTLRAWNADTVCARDLSKTVLLRLGRDLGEAPSNESLEEMAGRVLFTGDEGAHLVLESPSAPTPWGVWEESIDNGGVSDAGSMRTLAQAELDRRARTRAQFTRALILSEQTAHWPLVDYQPGDWITAPTNVSAERVRVAQITVTQDASGVVSGSVVLNDRVLDAELRRAKRMAGIVGGSSASGGSGARPAPEGPDRRTPAAPPGLVVDTDAYIDSAGVARGLVTAGWGAVSAATDGTAMEIAGYDLALRDNIVGAPWAVVRSTEELTATYGPAEVGKDMQAKVRARGKYSTTPGAWSKTVTFTVADDVTPPPVPSTPVVSVDRKVVLVRWDGKSADGGRMPADFHRVELERESDLGAVAGSILDIGGGTVLLAGLPYGQPQRLRARAVDRSGNASAWSPWSAPVTPKPLVPEDLDDAVELMFSQLADAAAQTAANGKSRINYLTAAPTDKTPGRPGDIAWVRSGNTITAQYLCTAGTGAASGTTWEKQTLTSATIANLDVGVLTAGTAAVDGAVISKLWAQIIQANDIEADTVKVGALDGYVITGATVRTAASGARVQLSGSTLRAYNASGTVTAEISGASATFTGATFRTSATPTSGGLLIDSSGLKAYNASGAVTAQISAASSTITGGTFQSVAGTIGQTGGSGYRLTGTSLTTWNNWAGDGVYPTRSSFGNEGFTVYRATSSSATTVEGVARTRIDCWRDLISISSRNASDVSQQQIVIRAASITFSGTSSTSGQSVASLQATATGVRYSTSYGVSSNLGVLANRVSNLIGLWNSLMSAFKTYLTDRNHYLMCQDANGNPAGAFRPGITTVGTSLETI